MEQKNIPKWQQQIEEILRKNYQCDELAEQVKKAIELTDNSEWLTRGLKMQTELQGGKMKTETKLISAIFCRGSIYNPKLLPFKDDELRESVDGITLHEAITSMLDSLENLGSPSKFKRWRQVLEMRVGFNGNEPMTLEAVGRVFGLTRERIREIEAKALRILRHPTRLRQLRPYIKREKLDNE